ncbi:hypothetical protein Q7P35_002785 [Cladosporium inversicolor]
MSVFSLHPIHLRHQSRLLIDTRRITFYYAEPNNPTHHHRSHHAEHLLHDRAPVASHTRQNIAAAAVRAATYTDRGILVRVAGRIARQASPRQPGPLIPPTLEEMRAAIPDHGIMLAEFFELFFSRVRGSEDHAAFFANFKALAAQDPVTELIFAKITPAQASAMQDANGNVPISTSSNSRINPVAPPTGEALAAAASRTAQNMDNMIYMGGAWHVTGTNAVPPTLEGIRAAIPEEGITVHALVRPFSARLLSNMDSCKVFISLVITVAQQDPVTNLVFLRK